LKKSEFIGNKRACFAYKDIFLFSSLSFSVRQGSFLAIVGPNGVGKTSLLRIIVGLLDGYIGNVRIYGKDIKSYDRGDMARLVSYVPQNIAFTYPISTYFFLRTALLNVNGEENKKKIISRYLDVWNAIGMEKKFLNKMSGGERQIALLIRAFLQDTPLIVADEPFSHLDIKNRIEYMRYLMILAIAFSKSIIVALHDINIAYNFFDYALILFGDGKYIYGKTDSIMNTQNLRKAFGNSVNEVFVSRRKFLLYDI